MRRSLLCAAVLCLAAAGGIAAFGQQSEPAARTFQFRYRTVVKEIPAEAGKVEVWLPFPSSDAHQTIQSVRIDAPGPITVSREPEYGNQVLYVRVDHPQ